MPRILFVLKDTTANGLTREVLYFAKELPQFGFDVFVASWRGRPKCDNFLTLTNDRVAYCDVESVGVSPALLRLISLIKEVRPEVVYAYVDSLPALQAICRFKPRIRLVKAEGRKIMEWSPERIQLYKTLAPLFDQIVVTSVSMRERFRQAGLDIQKCELLESAVDTDLFRPNTDSANAKRSVGVQSEKAVCLNVARLVSHKRPSQFARTAKLVAQTLTSSERPIFIWLGASTKQPFRRLIDSLGIKFATTSLNPEKWYPAAEVFLMTSRDESCPNSLLEAMSCELPVVTTRSYESIETLVNEDTGFIVDSVREAATAVRRLLLNANLRSSMGRNARRTVIARNSLQYRLARFREAILS